MKRSGLANNYMVVQPYAPPPGQYITKVDPCSALRLRHARENYSSNVLTPNTRPTWSRVLGMDSCHPLFCSYANPNPKIPPSCQAEPTNDKPTGKP